MSTHTCPSCGSQLEDSARYCQGCGTAAVAIPSADTAWPIERRGGPSSPGGEPPSDPTPAAGNSSTTQWEEIAYAGDGTQSPNDTYLGNRLLYRDKPAELDPLTNATLLRALLSRAITMTVIWFVGFAILTFIFMLVGLSSLFDSPSYYAYGGRSSSSSTESTFYGWLFLASVWSIVWACIFWLAPLGAQVSEWMFPLEGRGGAASEALDHMYTIIHKRRTPVTRMSIVRYHPPVASTERYYLQLRTGNYRGFVSCFAYGQDLFIGWTFWIRLSPAEWLAIMFRRIARGSVFYAGLSSDDPKAMREMLHGAVREGVDVAIGRIESQGDGLGSDLDVPVIIARAASSEAS